MVMNDIVIIGAGGFGREVAQLIEDINADKKTWNLLGFIDETVKKQNTIINDSPVLGDFKWLEENHKNNLYAVFAIGNPRDKLTMINRAKAYDINYTNLIHPGAQVSKFTELGTNCIICCNSVLSVNTKVGNHVSINPYSGIGHDTFIEDYASLYWNVTLSGNVHICEGCEIGSKAVVIPKRTVGKWSTIGAGAVVVSDLPENCIAVGVPAKPIKYFNA
jgi:sugar O-acyltransferase (sialic acid O-acetyltransferase NeuD family)